MSPGGARRVIAVDGPAGAGKGLVCRAVAAHFDLLYLETGALYRAVGLLALRRNIFDPVLLGSLSATLPFVFRLADNGGYQALLDGEMVTEALRNEEVGQMASRVAALPEVRQGLLLFQRGYGGQCNVILDGRDVGSVVFPQADLKLFLTASLEERARRRAQELQAKKELVNFPSILASMAERDARDSERSHAPLKPAEDAVLVDTTSLSPEQSIQQVIQLVAERLRLPGKHQPQE